MNFTRLLADFFSLPYRAGFQLWKFVTLHRRRPHIPAYTISVGNLTVGGSGKTPFVIELAHELKKRGIKFAVISRGYMRKSRGLVSIGPEEQPDVRALGDEPALIYRKLNGRIPIVVNSDRFRAGKHAVEKFDVEAVLLDDAFQHLKILHDYVILLLNVDDVEGGALLPFGRFREPLSALKRADLIVVNYRHMEFDDRQFNFGITPYIRMRYRIKLPVAAGTKAFVFAGIARPTEFIGMLEKAGIEVVGYRRFRDHRWYSERTVRSILKKGEKHGADVILTTEKDYIRLSNPPDVIKPVELIAEIENIEHIASILTSKIMAFRRIGT